MNFLRRLFGSQGPASAPPPAPRPQARAQQRRADAPRQPPPPLSHRLTLAPAAAQAIREIAAEERLDIGRINVVVARRDGSPSLDLSEDLALRSGASHAVAVSNGLHVVIPHADAQSFDGVSIEYVGGGFRFDGEGFPQTSASDPGAVELSRERLLSICPGLARSPRVIENIAWHLRKGDSRAAIVAAVRPLVIAAYTDELDAVALLRFPDQLAANHALKVGSRLLTVNTYEAGSGAATDLVAGSGNFGRYRNFAPLIAEFFAADESQVAQRKSQISPEEWERARALAQAAMPRAAGRYRDGRPPASGTPAY